MHRRKGTFKSKILYYCGDITDDKMYLKYKQNKIHAKKCIARYVKNAIRYFFPYWKSIIYMAKYSWMIKFKFFIQSL